MDTIHTNINHSLDKKIHATAVPPNTVKSVLNGSNVQENVTEIPSNENGYSVIDCANGNVERIEEAPTETSSDFSEFGKDLSSTTSEHTPDKITSEESLLSSTSHHHSHNLNLKNSKRIYPNTSASSENSSSVLSKSDSNSYSRTKAENNSSSFTSGGLSSSVDYSTPGIATTKESEEGSRLNADIIEHASSQDADHIILDSFVDEGPPISIEVTSAKEGLSDDDEYFEDFHLPNTHENAFVRHQSFRKKVQLTPIHAPDADHVEGLVRTGDANRYGSIRRRILPEEKEEDLDDCEHSISPSLSSVSDRFRRDIQEIENMIQNENLKSDEKSVEESYTRNGFNDSSIRDPPYECTSTPKPNKSTHPLATNDQILSEYDLSAGTDDSLIIGQRTLRRIKDCLNVSKYKSIYHLSGRLQDILSPGEIEEILSNSDIYSQYLTAEVLEALSMSLHDQSESLASSPGSSLLVNYASKSNSKNLSKNLVEKEATNSPGHDRSMEYTNSSLRLISAPNIDLDSIDNTELTISSTNDSTNISEYLNSTELADIEEQSPVRVAELKKISVVLSPLSTMSDDSSMVSSIPSERGAHIEINTIAPIGLPNPFSTSEMESIPPPPPDLIPELTAVEELSDERHWRNVVIAGAWKRIDMKVVSPYKMCISHGGYTEENKSSVIVVSSSMLPERSKKDYNYVMDNLLMYALSFVEQLVSDDYIMVYLAGGRRSTGPSFHWMRKAYDMIDRRLRKNMKQLLIVHPSLWSRTLVVLSRPFISSKFYRKLNFVYCLTDLAQIVPLDQLEIPDIVKRIDFELMIKHKKRGTERR